MQDDKEGANVKASEEVAKAEDGVKGEGDIKEAEAEADQDETKLGSGPKQSDNIEEEKPAEDGKQEEMEAENKEEVKKEETKKEEAKKEPKEQLPEKPTLQLHGKHSTSGKFDRFLFYVAW